MNARSFRYRAARADGQLLRGRIAAPTRSAALQVLSERGLHPIDVSAEGEPTVRPTTLPIADLALLLRLLADLLDAGVPLVRALQMLETMVAPRIAVLLPAVVSAVTQGRTLASALHDADVIVPPEVLGMIRAGERGGGLTIAIRQAGLLCEDSAATRGELRSALAYPLLLAIAGTASLALLVGIVLPRFASILGELGQTLPLTTRVVLRGGAVAKQAAIPTLALAAVLTAALRAWTSAVEGRRAWHRFLLALPVIGDLRLGAAGARICMALSALLVSGVPIVSALRSAAASAGDEEIMSRMLAARDDLKHGARFSVALNRRRAASIMVERLVRAGEESGQLASILSHAGALERERVLRRVRGIVRLVEPALIVGFGGVVALVAAALLQALYSVRPGG